MRFRRVISYAERTEGEDTEALIHGQRDARSDLCVTHVIELSVC